MIPREIVHKVALIEIAARKIVTELLAGEYRSVFKGHGTEFDEVREYTDGDDFHDIDWNVTARRGHLYIKRFIEERQRTLFLLVDMSASGAFGTTGRTKNELAAEFCAVLAFSAIHNQDRVGLMIFTDSIELFIPPGQGERHVLFMISELLQFRPGRTGTDIAGALEYFGKMNSRRCIAFLISDFQDSGYEKSLQRAAAHFDLVAVPVRDPVELEMPDAGLIELRDNETGRRIVADSTSARATHARAVAEAHEQLCAFFQRNGVDMIELIAGRDYIDELIRFFRLRQQRLKYEVAR